MHKMDALVLVFVVVCVGFVRQSHAHGRLMNPPGRSSLWRAGLDCPINYNDHELFCGGFNVQWHQNAGQCGICGDNWAGPRENEAGGKYACGIISKRYDQGQSINVSIEVTVFHQNGWFEFRLCPHNNVAVPATHECLDRHILELADGSGTRWTFPPDADIGWYHIMVRLPADVTCEQCILQWKWHTGNRWGTDPKTGKTCTGCGPQEEFYGCADIGITSPAKSLSGNTGNPGMKQQQKCRAIGAAAANPKNHVWCNDNCKIGHCPSKFCKCD